MDTSKEEISSLPSNPEGLSCTATHKDPSKANHSPRPQHFDLLARHHLGSQVSQSNPDLFTNNKTREIRDSHNCRQWADDFRGESLSKGQFEVIVMANKHVTMCIISFEMLFHKKQFHEGIMLHSRGMKLIAPHLLPDDDSCMLSCQDNFLPQSRAPQPPRPTDPGVRRKCQKTDKRDESSTTRRLQYTVKLTTSNSYVTNFAT